MRICVFGGTGVVGRAVLEHLAGAGHELLVVHRGHTEPADLPEAEHLHVERHELRAHHLRECDAAVDTFAMTAALADAAIAALPEDVPVLVLSSMDVYRAYSALLAGRHTEPVPLDEDSPVRERRYPYRGQPIPKATFDVDEYEKLDVEESYLAREATVLRLGFVYGPHDRQRREEFILRRVRAGRARIPFGSGGWIGTRTCVKDVGPAVAGALEREHARGEVFNVGERRSPTIRLWAEQILAAAGSDAELVQVPDDRLPPDLALTGSGQPLLASSDKARALLGWEETDPDTALRRSVEWHLAHPPEDASADFSADDEALVSISALPVRRA